MDILFMTLDKTSHVPLYEQIYLRIRNDIIEGKLDVHQKLPSKRKLEEFLNVSQTTIELAYGQLVAEGYVRSKPRSGFFVEHVDGLIPPLQTDTQPMATEKPKQYTIDFSPGRIDTYHFPFRTWRKYARDLIDEGRHDLLQLGHPYGEYLLREQIARYLYASRGVEASAEQIIIGSGTEQLLPMLMRLLPSQEPLAIENPGYFIGHPLMEHLERPIVRIPVDRNGMKVDQLHQSKATAVYVTPSHQFPTGSVLSASRKAALFNWATAQQERMIIEDDYDSEFRYRGKPIPALQSLDNGQHVVYMSTFSKSFMPSLRIAFMVLPFHLLSRYEKQFGQYASTVPRFDQYLLAAFMRDGHYTRHLNRMRLLYKRKVQRVTETLAQYDNITYEGDQAGLHLTVTIQTGQDEKTLMQAAEHANIRITPLSTYGTFPKPYDPTFIIGFAAIEERQINKAIQQLMNCWSIPQRQNLND